MAKNSTVKTVMIVVGVWLALDLIAYVISGPVKSPPPTPEDAGIGWPI